MAVTISGSDGISGDLPTIKVGNGSESAPAVTGQDTDTGLSFGTNEIKVSTGGTAAVTVDSSQQVGIGTTSPTNQLHILDNTAANDRRELKIASFRPGIRLQDLSGSATSAEIVGDNSLKFNVSTPVDDDTALTQRMAIDTSGRVAINSGYLELNGNNVGGIQVTIADDAFATITPPRQGQAWIFVQTNSGATFPKNSPSGFALIDFGSSPAIRTETVNAEFETNSGGPPTGTTGSDNHLTLFYGGTAGEIYLENRLGSSVAVQLTFL